MASSQTCLVTGGAGFIGCAISQDLHRHYQRVVAIDNLHPQVHPVRRRPSRLHPSVELIEGDVTVAELWDEVLSRVRPDVIVHLAAETGTGQSLLEAARHTHVNVTGTAVMLDALARNSAIPRRIVIASSRAVYGEGAWFDPRRDAAFYPGQRSREQLDSGHWDFDGRPLPMRAGTTNPAPVSVYGATKLAQEHILASWCNAVGCHLVTLRLQNVYGPGQSLSNAYTGIVSLFCQMAERQQSIPLYEDGGMIRDFVFIDDVAAALLSGVVREGIAGDVFDIGFGKATTIGDAAAAIAVIYNSPAAHVCAKFRYGDVRHAYADISQAGARLGWAPQTGLDAGLRALSAWISTEQHEQG